MFHILAWVAFMPLSSQLNSKATIPDEKVRPEEWKKGERFPPKRSEIGEVLPKTNRLRQSN